MNSDKEMKEILLSARTIASVGLSSNQEKESYWIVSYLKEQGYRIFPVNPTAPEILGEKAYPDLFAVPGKVDLVDVFRRSDEAGTAVDQAIAIGAKGVWLQEGVIDRNAAQRALDAGLLVVMDRCWLKEHIRNNR